MPTLRREIVIAGLRPVLDAPAPVAPFHIETSATTDARNPAATTARWDTAAGELRISSIPTMAGMRRTGTARSGLSR